MIVSLGSHAYSNVNPWLTGSGATNCSALAAGGTLLTDALGDDVYLGVVCSSASVTGIWVSDDTACGSSGSTACMTFADSFVALALPQALLSLRDFQY